MTLEDLHQLFSQPTDNGVAEAVWRFHQHHPDWPSYEDAILWTADWPEVAGDVEEAERRLLSAIGEDEVLLKFHDDGTWRVALDESMADRIARRFMHMTMERKEKEDTW